MHKVITFWFTIFCLFLAGCQGGWKSGPNIRKVKLDIKVEHFEKDLFSLDSSNLSGGLRSLKQKYGQFYDAFIYNIAAFSMEDEDVLQGQVLSFIQNNRSLYQQLEDYIPHLNSSLKEIENALKRAKVYFADMPIPSKIITYLGPLDGFGAFALDDSAGIAVGLQQFLGSNYPAYQTDYLQAIFGKQRINQFVSENIAPTALRAWVEKVFPDKGGRRTLKEKLIEEGRKSFLLKALLPDTPDSLIFGFSPEQMEWCISNSLLIKQFFENEDLYKTDSPELIVEYFSETQRSEQLPEAFPSKVASYMGFLLVKEYMNDHAKTPLSKLMNMNFWMING